MNYIPMFILDTWKDEIDIHTLFVLNGILYLRTRQRKGRRNG